jgi:DNA-binding CsgD family transcriptional regulator
MNQLDSQEREALLTVSLESAGDELILSRAAGETAVFDRLSRLGLVRMSAGRLEPRHPLVRSLAVDRSTAEERRRVHAALATAVAPGDARIRHLALAAEDPDEGLASDLEDLGRRAGMSGDGAWALERAAALTPAGPARERRSVRAAQAVWDAGDAERARMLIGEASIRDDPEARHKSAVLEARLLIAEGGLVEGARMLIRLADDVTAITPAEAAELLIESALALASAHQVAAGFDVIRRARGLELGDDPVVRLGIASAEADLRWLSGDVSGAVRQVRAAARTADRDPRVHANRRARLRLSEAYFGCADYQRAREITQAVVRDARAGAALSDLRYALSILFSVELRTGRVTAMSVAAHEELELAAQFGLLMEQEEALGHVAWCHALTGQADECRSRVAQRLELGARIFANPLPHPSLGVLELGLGRPQQAVAALRRTMDALRARDLPSSVSLMPHRPDLIEAYVHARDVAAASSELAELELEARALDTPDGLALLHRCRGLLAGPDSIDEEFTRALEYDQDEPRPLDRARSLLCWGESLRRVRRRADARTPLRLAFEEFSRLGADLWTPRALRELDAVGRRNLPRLDKPAVRLTRSEIGVAALVTEGMSNREVAMTLFVSINTVESHLRHLFAKLGVRSRTELSRRFTEIRDSELAADS